ncbi:unnamed protein product [Trifolium pratense]|uniref:Uncharacterized protein n=1 Tax=Trifolium pratense TaxID=57577 RepID=A0ACB0LX39_TRIPR|nr:unnamed protein product [Trifolium pratense]
MGILLPPLLQSDISTVAAISLLNRLQSSKHVWLKEGFSATAAKRHLRHDQPLCSSAVVGWPPASLQFQD